jgi:hypothetical protein
MLYPIELWVLPEAQKGTSLGFAVQAVFSRVFLSRARSIVWMQAGLAWNLELSGLSVGVEKSWTWGDVIGV